MLGLVWLVCWIWFGWCVGFGLADVLGGFGLVCRASLAGVLGFTQLAHYVAPAIIYYIKQSGY